MERAYFTPFSDELFDGNIPAQSPSQGADRMNRTILHRNIVLFGLITGFLVAVISYLTGQDEFALGLLFSLPLALANLKAIDKILTFAFGLLVPEFVRAAAFVIYHMRFLLLVIIMYHVIPKAGYDFAVGTFVGFLIAKIILGTEILKNQ